MNKPISVGITGGIGAGKTLITKLFSLLNVPIYNADIRAKELMNTILIDEITTLFGTSSFVDGQLNRNFIAHTVFNDPKQLNALNSIVHPAVATDFEKWKHQQIGATYVIKEAALLIEGSSYKQLDKLIVVTCPLKLRIERIKQRDRFRSVEEVNTIIGSQTDDKTRIRLADYIIKNDETNMLIPQVLTIDKKIRQY